MDLTSYQAIHQSAQYLAAAAKSFLPEQSTDFHTSLIWDADLTSFVSHEISEEGARLALNLEYYSLQVKSNTEKGPGKNPGLFVFSYLIPQSSNNNWRPQ